MTQTTTAKSKGKGKQHNRSTRPRKGKPRGWRTAATSDIHELYELSVQEPEAECDLIDQVWKDLRKRKCQHVREDFCGTSAMAMQWIKHREGNTAICVDIDTDVLAWARAKMQERLTPAQQKKLTFIEGDVRQISTDPVDSVCAMNFSYYLFKTRDGLRDYFKHVHKQLKEDGLFLLDAYGGSEAFMEIEEPRDLDGFTYIWDQAYYNPITGEAINHIHFKFPDGTRIRKAFSYEWRLWTLPEIQEILLEAGFKNVVVYWEGYDEDSGEGNGEFTITTRGDACEGWIAYLVAER